MDYDVIVVGGGVGGSSLAATLAAAGRSVLVLEREPRFRDRVRGENMLPWGVASARRLGLVEPLLAAGAIRVPFFDMYALGERTEHRPLPETTPHGEGSLNVYHPDMQEALLTRALAAGATVERGALVERVTDEGDGWRVEFRQDGRGRSLKPRLLVGADGRGSRMRTWGGFQVRRAPDFLRIAGTVVHGTRVPDEATHLAFGPGFATFIAPLGDQRARMYFIYVGATGDRRLSGKGKIDEFLDGCRATGAPADWFDGTTATGPLAEFEGADSWAPHPGKPGLALIGDAAAASDPSWGSGLAKTITDVEHLSNALLDTDDWHTAVDRYATQHDEYAGKLRDILSWMTTLVWSNGPEADARRQRVFPRMHADPTGFPDPAGLGPFGPCDEHARRLVLGET